MQLCKRYFVRRTHSTAKKKKNSVCVQRRSSESLVDGLEWSYVIQSALTTAVLVSYYRINCYGFFSNFRFLVHLAVFQFFEHVRPFPKVIYMFIVLYHRWDLCNFFNRPNARQKSCKFWVNFEFELHILEDWRCSFEQCVKEPVILNLFLQSSQVSW